MNPRSPLAVIGGGRMGEAIVGGLVAGGSFEPAGIVVAEPDAARREALAAAHGVRCVADGREALAGASTVLLAVKPQVIDDVARALAGSVEAGALVVSIAAGVTCARLEALLPAATPVVRVMPNTHATPAHVEEVRALFGALGLALVIDERHQDVATAISGSGPAYVALFVDSLTRAGVRHGLSREIAERLALRTLAGTADLLELTGQTPEQLIEAVSSPGGTTVAAMGRLEAGGFAEALDAAVTAAVDRAKELGS
jgi:pyrroline-5-carboxylate reductase